MTARARGPEPVRIGGGPVPLAGLDYGNREAPALVLLHGIRDLAWSMDPIATALASRFHVISLDLRGHGDSGSGAYTMAHFVADLHAAARELRLERPVLVAHSLGGQIAAQYAALFPGDVAACALIEGLGPPLREGETAGRRDRARAEIESLETRAEPRPMPDLEAAVARVRRNHPRLDPERARFLAERGTRPHPSGGLRWKFDPAVGDVWASFSREQNEERWGWIECPVLIVSGERSGEFWERRRLGPGARAADLERRLALFRDARHVEIPGAGHMVHFDAPDALNTAIAGFLAELQSSAGPRARGSADGDGAPGRL